MSLEADGAAPPPARALAVPPLRLRLRVDVLPREHLSAIGLDVEHGSQILESQTNFSEGVARWQRPATCRPGWSVLTDICRRFPFSCAGPVSTAAGFSTPLRGGNVDACPSRFGLPRFCLRRDSSWTIMQAGRNFTFWKEESLSCCTKTIGRFTLTSICVGARCKQTPKRARESEREDTTPRTCVSAMACPCRRKSDEKNALLVCLQTCAAYQI